MRRVEGAMRRVEEAMSGGKRSIHKSLDCSKIPRVETRRNLRETEKRLIVFESYPILMRTERVLDNK